MASAICSRIIHSSARAAHNCAA